MKIVNKQNHPSFNEGILDGRRILGTNNVPETIKLQNCINILFGTLFKLDINEENYFYLGLFEKHSSIVNYFEGLEYYFGLVKKSRKKSRRKNPIR